MIKNVIRSLILLIIVLVLLDCNVKQASNEIQIQVKGKIDDIAVNLVTDMTKGDFEKAYNQYSYTAEMLKAINAKFLKEQLWDHFISSYGPFKEVEGFSTSQNQGYDIISVKTTFEKLKININIVFDSSKLIAGINYTTDTENAIKDIPEDVNETIVEFGKSGWELPGTLTIPENGEKHPVVILVHGSGPNDRNESIGPNKPFRDIAWGLAKEGIATLRYDKRTFVYSAKFSSLSEFTVYDEVVEDVILAIQYLKTLENIDTNKIYILGHSLGGMLIPRIAQETVDVAGYIAVAAPVSHLEDIIIEQIRYINGLDGNITDDEKKAVELYEKMRDNVKKLDANTSFDHDELFGIPASYWLDLKDYNPAEAAKEISNPLLILQGERDYQVSMKEFEIWKDTLGNPGNVTYISYAGLNHILIKGTDKSQPDEYNIIGQIDDEIIEDIAAFVK